MLKLTDIVKDYHTGSRVIHALRGVSLAFGESGLVALLGPSGSGKTTLLNILGGLDGEFRGELSLHGSILHTDREKDRDSYRTGAVGFVLRDGALLPQLSAAENVELALTVSAVPRTIRRRRAADMLRRMGLGEKLRKKPGDLSGVERQRVAVARAIINDPDIVLCDEPAGELDGGSAAELMELLREIARSRLVIVATHDDYLAEEYASRIIRLTDGEVTDDDAPFTASENGHPAARKKHGALGPAVALRLSRAQFAAHKGRTLLSILACSLGVLAAALLLSLSGGVEREMGRVQSDTLAAYPITVTAQGNSLASRIAALDYAADVSHGSDAVYADAAMAGLLSSVLSSEDDGAALRTFLETLQNSSVPALRSFQCRYAVTPLIYASDTSAGPLRVNPASVFDGLLENYAEVESVTGTAGTVTEILSTAPELELWTELPADGNILRARYDILSGRWPQEFNEVVLITDTENEISDVALISLGLRSVDDMRELLSRASAGEVTSGEPERVNYEELLSRTFRLLLPSDMFTVGADGRWAYLADDPDLLQEAVNHAQVLRVVGVLRARDSSAVGQMGYTAALTDYIRTQSANSPAAAAQKADPSHDIFTGLPFRSEDYTEPGTEEKAASFVSYVLALPYSEQIEPYTALALRGAESEITALSASRLSAVAIGREREALVTALVSQGTADQSTAMSAVAAMSESETALALPRAIRASVLAEKTREIRSRAVSLASGGRIEEELKTLLASQDESTLAAFWSEFVPPVWSDMTYEENLMRIGAAGLGEPVQIDLYAASFSDKAALTALIEDYNRQMGESGRTGSVVCYSDSTGSVTNSASGILSVLRTLLNAFTALSFVISCILAGALTRISTLERTRESAILRLFGASAGDVKRVFCMESLVLGFWAGVAGLALTIGINRVINTLAASFFSLEAVAELPWLYAVLLVPLGMALSLLAGLIPAERAAGISAAEVLRGR